MNKSEAIDFFLKSLNIEDDSVFAKYIDSISTLIKKKKKDVLFLESQEGVDMYFLISGSIKLYKTNEEGRGAVIHFVEPGEFFAEIVLFLKNRYPVSAVAIKSSTLLSINATKMFEIIKKDPQFAMKFIGIFAHRLNYMANVIKNLSIMDAKNKFLQYLNSIKNKDGLIELNIPKQEIALLLGIAPETFSRVLNKLSNEGVISIDGKKIQILQ